MRKNASRPDAENPEWIEEAFGRARPALEVLPKEAVEAIRRDRGQRGPQKSPTKELVSLRVDREVVAAYRASGPGWQTRANEALRAYAKKGGLHRRLRSRGRAAKRRSVAAKRS
jgi:uncharacterized protein (DUF4415 family)